MKEVIRYACDFCGKVFVKARNCEWHERRCYFDPDHAACVTCAHFKYLLQGNNPSRGETCYGCELNCSLYIYGHDEEGQSRSTLRSECNLWEKRTATKHLVKFGRTRVETKGFPEPESEGTCEAK